MIKNLLFGLLAAIALLMIYIFVLLSKDSWIENDLIIEIKKNSSTSAIIDSLNQHGYLKPSAVFAPIIKIYSIFSGKYIQSGYYRFPADTISNYTFLKGLFSRKFVYSVDVTLVEGMGIAQFADILEKKLEINKKEFLRLSKSDTLLKKYQIRQKSCEGYLAPNTYRFMFRHNSKDILIRLLEEADKNWKTLFSAKSKKIGKTKSEILTMASIIEAEAVLKEELPRIAGVYYNRLQRNMRLEADPTVQFAVGSKHKLTKTDLETVNPYNTYVFSGLPPGPINNPGIKAIEAALSPEEHNYIFFVAAGDGSHNFSVNYQEHLANVVKYRNR
ncbi:MAG: endolytic transglycosylase MltG [Candidatus Kapabacteria bacterium]|nr:endolytic transglycosylase MltG [Candidatus Kapabacteria bacterium]